MDHKVPCPLPFAFFPSYLGGILVAGFLAVTVLFTSSAGFDETLEAWEAVLVPQAFALRALEKADRFYWNPNYPRSRCHTYHSLESAWQFVRAHPKADSLFLQLYLTGRPMTRLLALAGLEDLHSGVYEQILAAARSNSGSVAVLPPYPEVSASRSLASFARDSAGLTRFVEALRTPNSEGCAR